MRPGGERCCAGDGSQVRPGDMGISDPANRFHPISGENRQVEAADPPIGAMGFLREWPSPKRREQRREECDSGGSLPSWRRPRQRL